MSNNHATPWVTYKHRGWVCNKIKTRRANWCVTNFLGKVQYVVIFCSFPVWTLLCCIRTLLRDWSHISLLIGPGWHISLLIGPGWHISLLIGPGGHYTRALSFLFSAASAGVAAEKRHHSSEPHGGVRLPGNRQTSQQDLLVQTRPCRLAADFYRQTRPAVRAFPQRQPEIECSAEARPGLLPVPRRESHRPRHRAGVPASVRWAQKVSGNTGFAVNWPQMKPISCFSSRHCSQWAHFNHKYYNFLESD